MTPTRVVFISKIPSVNTEIACVSRATYTCEGGGRKGEREEVEGRKGEGGGREEGGGRGGVVMQTHKYQAHV